MASPINCIACKPGYKPVESFLNGHLVSRCQVIPNCNENKNIYVNSCGECNKGFAFEYDSQNWINYSSCVKIIQENNDCLAFNSLTNKCIVCKKEFYLNYDGICEKMRADFCEDSFLINSLDSIKN